MVAENIVTFNLEGSLWFAFKVFTIDNRASLKSLSQRTSASSITKCLKSLNAFLKSGLEFNISSSLPGVLPVPVLALTRTPLLVESISGTTLDWTSVKFSLATLTKAFEIFGFNPTSSTRENLDPKLNRVSLFFNSSRLLKSFHDSGSQIKLYNELNKRDPSATVSTFEAFKGVPETSESHVDDLIVSMKTTDFEDQITPYLHRITNKTNVLFVNAPLGSLDSSIKRIWRADSGSVPNIFQAVTTYGLINSTNFDVKYTLPGKMFISAFPSSEKLKNFVRKQELYYPGDILVPSLIKDLIDIPLINAQYCPFKDLFKLQVERLVVDACLNPLGQLLSFDVQALRDTTALNKVIETIIDEAVIAIKASPWFKAVVNSDKTAISVIDRQRLFAIVKQSAKQYGYGSSDMLPDFATNYIVRNSKSRHHAAPVNNLLRNLLISKRRSQQEQNEIPIVK
ncbi:hypothetical protein OGAPHI_004080 [Ogataea philodendri]|uniref:Uncharacterized protein n=1 Tax=Ogataea philodendri TaxID=1378263 RepID=A0A9P8P6C5_9ASCO|nr:uncharacterized protein OGAPHI_004080 [Ogataea philodendri]KAH3665891.1 hypothetical protein OGAPHI_004080 [Ogataea philodendri]